MAREHELLRYINEDAYTTTSHLAELLGVSSRTVRSDIVKLNNELESHGARVISRPRRGVMLCVTDRRLYAQYRPFAEDGDLSQGERVQQVIEYLLSANRPVLMDDLADMLFYSRSTLKRDMREVRRILTRFDLHIDNRAYQGMRVEGREEAIRSCLAYVKKCSRVDDSIDEELIDDIREIITKQIENHHFKMSDLSIENIAIHLLIAVKRIQNGSSIQFREGMLNELRSTPWSGDVMDTAMAILEDVEGICQVHFSRSELYNFLMRLASKEIVAFDGDMANTVITEESYRVVSHMLDRVKASYQIDLSHDLNLVTTLSLHLIPLRTRMRYRMTSINPLLEDIRRNHVLAYSMASVACSVLVDEYGYEVPADEIAYVAMYLSVSLARHREGMRDNVLIVCGAGRASSELLAHQVHDAFGKHLNVAGTTSAHELEHINFTDIDYVLTTVKIEYPIPVPIIEISNLLSEGDVSHITRVLAHNHAGRLISSLIHPELVYWKDFVSKQEVISFLCAEVTREVALPEDFEKLVFEREKIGNTAFGNRVAIAHPIHVVGSDNVLALAILNSPIDWDGEDVQLVFLLTIGSSKTRELQSFYRIMNRLINSRELVDHLVRSSNFEEVERTLRTAAEA